jgi:signal transduction histidine kinase
VEGGNWIGMRDPTRRREPQAVSRAAQHVWLAVGFLLIWLHFSYVQATVRWLDWQLYCLYLVAVSGVATRYVTGVRYGHSRWHRVLFDALSIAFIAVGVRATGGITSDLWLVYFIFIIAETLAASARGFLITDAAAIVSYIVATWRPEFREAGVPQAYVEAMVTRIFFLVLVASIARTIAREEQARQADVGALREALSVSEERRRLARDLHDGIGHILTRVILSLEVARRQFKVDPQGAAESVGEQATALRGAMEEMRQIVATLRTETTSFDLRGALRGMAAQIPAGEELQVELKMPDLPIPLSPHKQYHLSRVVQEALTNCLRHSRASRAEIEVRVLDVAVGTPRVVATVVDNGIGFDAQNGHSGHGLKGMQERLAPYGGRVSIESAPGEGTRVTAEMPGEGA